MLRATTIFFLFSITIPQIAGTAHAATPTSVEFTDASPSSIDASWSLESSEQTPLYVLSTVSDFSTTVSSEVGGVGQENVQIQSLQKNTTYYFKVKVAGEPDANYSAPIAAATLATPPGAGPSVVLSSSDISISWTHDGNPGDTAYSGELAVDAEFTEILAELPFAPILSFVAEDLEPNTTFYFRVRAENRQGFPTEYRILPAALTHSSPPVSADPSDVFGRRLSANWIGDELPGTQYRAELSTGADFTGAEDQISPWLSGAESFEFAGLSTGTPYFTRAKSRGFDHIESPYTNLPSTTTQPFLETPAPSGVANASATPTALGFSWTLRNSNEAPLLVLADDADFTGIISSFTAGISQSSHQFTGLSINTSYWFKVKVSTANDFFYSDFLPVGTHANPPLPDATVVISSADINVSWTANSNPTGTLYTLSVHDDDSYANSLGESDFQPELSFLVTDLPPATTFYFRAQAHNHFGVVTAAVNLSEAMTFAQPPAALEPEQVLAEEIRVQWDTGDNPPGVAYQALLSTAADFTGEDDRDSGFLPDGNNFTFLGLALDTTYYAQVRARNLAGQDTDFIALPSTRTLSFPSALPPTDISFNAISSSTLGVNWVLGDAGQAPLYAVSASSDFATTLSSQTGVVGQQSIFVESLDANTTYYFKVKVSTVNDIFYSDLHETATLAIPPLPTATVVVSSSELQANWLHGGNPADTQYSGEIALVEDFSEIVGDTDFEEGTSLDIPFLTPNTTYHLRVRARNRFEVETATTVLPAAMTLAEPPTGAVLNDVFDVSMRLEWDGGDNPEGTEFFAQISTASDFSGNDDADSTWLADRSSFTFTALSQDTTYYARVKARNHVLVETAFTPVVSDITLPFEVIFPPDNINAAALSSGSLRMEWELGSPGQAPLFAFSAEEAFAAPISSQTGAVGQSSQTFPGLGVNTTYYFKIKVSTANDNLYAPTFVIATLAQVPVSSPTVVLSSSAILVQWGVGENPPGTLYSGEISNGEDFSDILAESEFNENTDILVTDLDPNTTFYLRVRARNFSEVETSTTALPTAVTLADRPSPGTPTDVLDTSLTLHWGNGDNPLGTLFAVEIASNPGFTLDYQTSPYEADKTSHSFFGLSLDTTYYARVRARNHAGIPGPYLTLSSTKTLAFPAVLPPTDIQIATVSPTELGFSWNMRDPSQSPLFVFGEDSEYSVTAASAVGGVDQSSHVATGLSINTTYYFKIKVSTAPDYFYTPSIATGTHAADPSPQPTVILSSQDIRVDWEANGNPAGTRYRAEISHNADFSSIVGVSPWTQATEFASSALIPNTTYYARVRARSHSNVHTATVALEAACTFADRIVASLSPDPAVNGLSLNWNPGGNSFGTEFQAEIDDNGAFASPGASGWLTATTTTFLNLTANTTYYTRVRARNCAHVETEEIRLATTATRAAIPSPAAATGVSVSTIVVNWENGGNPAGTEYSVEIADDGLFQTNYASTPYAGVLSSTFTGLATNSTHYFRVRARNWAGITTEPVALAPQATDADAPLAQPISFVSDVAISAAWSAAGNPPETLFQAQLSTNSDFTGTPTDSPLIAGQNFDFTSLLGATTYYLRVKARSHNGGDTAWVTLPSTMTAPGRPAAAEPQNVFGTSLRAHWGVSNNSAGTEFLVALSTAADYTGSLDQDSGWQADRSSHTFFGLTLDTTYYTRVKARSSTLEESDFTVLGSTLTLDFQETPPPTGVAFDTVAVNSVDAVWSLENPTMAALYQFSTLEDFSSLVSSETLPVGASSVTISALEANTTYYFKIKVSTANDLFYSDIISTATPALDPGALDPATLSSNAVVVLWNHGGNPSGTEFLAQRAEDSGFSTGLADGGWTTQNGSTFTALTPNTTYYLRVRSRGHNSTVNAPVVLSSTMTEAGPPLSPARTVLSSGGIYASFLTGENPPATEFLIQISSDANFLSLADTAGWAALSESTFTGLVPNTRYFMRAAARNARGVPTPFIEIPNARTWAQPPLAAPPQPVFGRTLTLNWLSGANPPLTQYFAQISTAADFSGSADQIANWDSILSYEFTGLTLDTTYYSRVKARNLDGVETAFVALAATRTLTFEETPPPTNVRYTTASPHSLDIAWSLLVGFQTPFYALSENGDFATTVSSQIGIPGQESVAIPDLAVNTTYYFKVKVSTAQDLFYSAVITTATEAVEPVSPAGVVLSSSDLRLEWGAGVNPAGTEFLAEAAADSAFTAGLASGAWTGSLSSTFTSLSANTSYYLRVRARNRYAHPTGNADAGPVATLAAVPLPGEASAVSSASFAANWGLNGNPADTEFIVERATDAAFGGSLADSEWNAALSSTFSALTPNTTHYLRVRARSRAGVETENASLTPVLTRAEAPGTAVFTNVFDTLLTAHWTAASNPPGTEFLAALSTAADFTGGGDQDSGWQADVTSFTFKNLELATTYYLRAQARNAAFVETGFTALGSTTTLPFSATLPPSQISFTTAAETALDAVWTLENGEQAPLYALSTTEGFATTVSSLTGSVGQSSAAFTGLSLNTTYWFKIKVSTAADLFYSSPLSTATHAAAPGAAPGVSLSSQSLAAQWTNGGNPAGTQFLAEAALDAAFSSGLSLGAWTENPASTFSSLSVNTTYYLRARARNRVGVHTSTTTLPALATDAGLPGIAAAVVLSSTAARAEWTAGGNPAGTEFQASVSTNAGFSPMSTAPWTTLSNSTFTGLAVNTTHYWRVAARSHNGSETQAVLLTPSPTLADVPESGSPAAISSTSLRAEWGIGNNPQGTQFRPELASDAAFIDNFFAGGWTVATLSTFSALTPNTTYYTRVRARNHAGIETSSIALTVVATHASPPTAEILLSLSTGGVFASWGANANSPGTQFLAEVSTDAAFGSAVSTIGWIAQTNATFTALAPNATYYARVRARSFGEIETAAISLGAAVTRAQAPLSAEPVTLSSSDIRAAWDPDANPETTESLAQAALDAGFTLGLADSGWRTGTSSEFATLTPNTSYYLRVKSRSHGGIETAFTALPATMTFAAPPQAQDPSRVFSTQITAHWGAGANPSGTQFSAEISTAADFSGTADQTGAWTQLSSHTFSGLSAETVYFSRVRARNHRGVPGAYTALPATTTLSAETLPPSAVAFDTAAATALDASWILDNPTQAPFYALSLSSSFATTVSSITGAVGQSSASIGGLTPNTTYWFTVKVSTAQDIFYSIPIATPTHAAVPLPGAPTALSPSSLSAAWTANDNPGDTLYLPEAALDAAYTAGVVSGSWTTGLSQTFSGLSADATYYLRVRAQSRAGIQTSTAALPETATFAAPPGASAPSAQSSSSFRANWTTGGNTAPTTYVAEISTVASFSPLRASSTTTAAFADFAGLDANVRHYARARAVSHNGTPSADVALNDGVTLATVPANAQISLILSQTLTLTWAANGNAPGTEYRAQRATDAGFTADLGDSGWVAAATTSLSGLTQQTTYYVRLRARNLEGVETADVFVGSAATLATPNQPSSIAFSTVSVSSLTAVWEHLVPGAISLFALSTRADFATTVASQTAAANQESVTLTGLAANTTFYFKVKFENQGDAGYTAPLATATLAAAPGTPAQGSASTTDITAAWDGATNGPGTVYTFEFDDDALFASIDASSVTLNSSATISGLQSNSRYYGRVRAKGHRGDQTAVSPGAALSTLSDAPGAAATPLVSVTFSSVTARWTPLPSAPSTATAVGYVLEASTAADFSGILSSHSVLSSTDSLSVGGLAGGTTYYLRVGSLNLDLRANYLALGSTRTLVSGSTQQHIADGQVFSVTVTPPEPEVTSVTVEIPVNALPAGSTITINTGVSFFLPPPQSNQSELTMLGTGVGIEIDAGGAQPLFPVTIRYGYNPALIPAGKKATALVMARYDPVSAQWTLLPSTVDTAAATLTGLTDHFSLFAPFFATASTALDGVQIFPVPWEPGAGGAFDAQVLTFSKLPEGTEVKILSIHGESLKEFTAPASGLVQWNGRNSNGYRVASGTFVVLFKSNGARATRRVVVIR